ncbi:N-acetylmuramoyl-L-alanine amidase [Thalassobaculum fulvum]|uniref:N-acetylmuramoyl-L-alanine amidase n=1 Tax=Thalassobaculum fulvum TaxID=1633335 RepID=A0A918XSX3_9PROT|nr:N-acetylmuramoyl-L-alanine amidase [Thalassobaculum fulvum]GHD53361.1 N-acetylmuramoyl-L-alanine amidase [Thalassobaculum fulvum]
MAAVGRFLAVFAVAVAIAAGTLAVGAHGSAARAEPGVTDLRVGVHPDKIRFVLDLSERLDYFIFQLPDPYRIVVDLPQVDFALPDGGHSRRVGAITGWRYGLFEPGTSRVVIDAAAPLAVKSSFILPPSGRNRHRLVVDLVPTDREAFLTASNESVAKRVALRAPSIEAPAQGPASARSADPRKVIVIDPGHGGVDPGALGRGDYEKNIVLATARTLARRLEETGRYKVVMTRDRDVFIRLRDRIAIARRAGADLFMSLHADSIDDKSLRGLSVYTLSETASDDEAAALAASENKVDIIAGIDLSDQAPEVTDILIDLAQRRTKNLSARLAAYVVEEMGHVTPLLRRPHRFAGFAVLKAPDVPAVLVELGFLSNPIDYKNLSSAAYRDRIAEGLARSIDDYFQGIQAAFR